MLAPIRVIIIPNYPDKVLISKSKRPVFYVSLHSKVKGKKELPKSFLNKKKFKFNDKGVLISTKTLEPQLANPRSVGQPRYWNVNFQEIWNGNVSRQARATKVGKLKDIIRPYIKETEPVPSWAYPIHISLEIYDSEFSTDVSNKGVIYTKIIEDLLVEEHVIIDDGPKYVTGSGGTVYIKVEKGDAREKSMRVKILTNT